MKRCRITLPILMACLIALTLVSISYGWIQNAWPSTIQFAAGSTPKYTFYKITFDKESEQTDGTPAKATVVEGTESNPLGIGTPIGSIESSTTAEDGTTVTNFSIADEDLQFGIITNLNFLENDNYVFYAIRIPYSMGTKVHAAVSYGAYDENGTHSVTFGNHFKIYNEDRIPITGEKLTQVQGIETTHGDTFVSYACALSENAPSQDMTFATLDFLFKDQEMSPVATMTKENGATSYTITKNSTDEPIGTFAPTDTDNPPEYYYLYIKLQPNMDLYKYFIDYLYADMPFYLAYQVGIQLYVTPETNS